MEGKGEGEEECGGGGEGGQGRGRRRRGGRVAKFLKVSKHLLGPKQSVPCHILSNKHELELGTNSNLEGIANFLHLRKNRPNLIART